MRRPSRLLAPLVGLLVALLAAPLLVAADGTLTSCATLSVRGGYALAQDVATSSDTCFDITVPGVSLSLGGHTVTGNGFNIGATIEPGATGARVQEGAVANFAVGVEDDASGAVVNDIAASGDTVGFQMGLSRG